MSIVLFDEKVVSQFVELGRLIADHDPRWNIALSQHHHHGRSKILAVSLALIDQKIFHGVHIGVDGRSQIERVSEVALCEMSLDKRGHLEWSVHINAAILQDFLTVLVAMGELAKVGVRR